jgi:ATP-dependent DNA helicase RecG
MTKLRIFVSSVQKELENERIAVAEVIWTDPFLSKHCEAVLYEYEPASPADAIKECLEEVERSDIYLLMVYNEYGYEIKGVSITHMEYERAKKKKLPQLVFIKGNNEKARSDGVRDKLLKEIRDDGLKYKRFDNYRDLQKEVRAALVKLLKNEHGLQPTSDETEAAEQTIERASDFGKQRHDLPWAKLNYALAKQLVTAASDIPVSQLNKAEVERTLVSRGLLWQNPDDGKSYSTAAAIVLLSDDPSTQFPQCRILADAYRGAERISRPDDQEEIREPMPTAIDRALKFIDRNTRHPMRVVGLNRIRLDEYPTEALREALVNAVAHRRYEQEGQKIQLEVFSDRVMISSPGILPKPLTLTKIRTGNYRAISRNPLIAHGLSFFHRIEERGSGFGRMKEVMKLHGLDEPLLSTNSGCFEISFPGPGDDLERIRVPEGAMELLIDPSVEAKLSKRQSEMLELMRQGQELTSRYCQEHFGVTRDSTSRDFKGLVDLGLAVQIGAGRSTKYVLAGKS